MHSEAERLSAFRLTALRQVLENSKTKQRQYSLRQHAAGFDGLLTE